MIKHGEKNWVSDNGSLFSIGSVILDKEIGLHFTFFGKKENFSTICAWFQSHLFSHNRKCQEKLSFSCLSLTSVKTNFVFRGETTVTVTVLHLDLDLDLLSFTSIYRIQKMQLSHFRPSQRLQNISLGRCFDREPSDPICRSEEPRPLLLMSSTWEFTSTSSSEWVN